MPIRNPDGTEYNCKGSLRSFDPESRDHKLFNTWDSEAIRIGGSPIEYYEIFINIDSVDTLYNESRSKLWSPIPIQVWGFYEPIPNQNAQGAFGIDAPDEMMFEFNYREFLLKVGHPPKVGARLFTPHKNESWLVIQRNDGEFKMWGQLRLQVICQKFPESLTNPTSASQAQPDFKLNTGSLLEYPEIVLNKNPHDAD